MKDVDLSIELKLPEKSILKLKEKSKELGFEKIQDYIRYVVDQILSEEIEESAKPNKEEEEEIKRKLKSLGYL